MFRSTWTGIVCTYYCCALCFCCYCYCCCWPDDLHEAAAIASAPWGRRLQKQHVGLQSSIELTPFPFHTIPYHTIPLPSAHFSSVQFSSVHMHLHWSRSGACNFLAYLPTNVYKYEFEWSLTAVGQVKRYEKKGTRNEACVSYWNG